MKLNDHKYNLHGNSSSSEDLFTPIKNSQKNKARKMANKQTKIKVEKVDTVMKSSESEAAKHRDEKIVKCPVCSKTMKKASFSKHKKLCKCKVATEMREEVSVEP